MDQSRSCQKEETVQPQVGIEITVVEFSEASLVFPCLRLSLALEFLSAGVFLVSQACLTSNALTAVLF